MSRIKVSIIIVHYNTDEFTKACLRSLEKINQTNLDVSVILVDNASMVPFSFGPKKYLFKLIRTTENTGFTGGNNIGIDHAFANYNPDYILLLNSDTVIEPNFLKSLVSMARKKQKVGSVSPKIYFQKGYEFHKNSYTEAQKGRVIWFAGGSIDWKNIIAFHRGVDEVDYGQFDVSSRSRTTGQIPYFGYETMDFSSGCCVLYPADVLKEVGTFDNTYFAYWEDVDLSVRMARQGYVHYFCPDSVIWHKNGGSTGGSGSPLQQKLQRKNRLKFAFKYGTLKSKFAILRRSLL